MSVRGRLWRSTRGSAAAEMAMVLPLLLTLMFGCMELGNYFWNEHIVVKAVRDGARFAGRQRFSSFPCPGGPVALATETMIKNVTLTGQLAGGAPRISGWTAANVAVGMACTSTTSTGIYANNSGGAPVVDVSADVVYPSLFKSLGFATNSLRIRANAKSAVMGL